MYHSSLMTFAEPPSLVWRGLSLAVPRLTYVHEMLSFDQVMVELDDERLGVLVDFGEQQVRF